MTGTRNTDAPGRGRATLRTAWWIGHLALLSLVLVSFACVETAQCDGTAPCEDGEVCYDYVCRPTCSGLNECGGGTCAACQQNDSEGQIDHCFGEEVNACLPAEES